MKNNSNFEKRRKGVESLLNIIFWIYLLEIIIYLGFKIAYATGAVSVDIFELNSFIVLLVGFCFMYFSTRLAHKGHIAAGIIGIVVGVIQICFGKLLGFIIGLWLFINSIMYLLCFEKKSGGKNEK